MTEKFGEKERLKGADLIVPFLWPFLKANIYTATTLKAMHDRRRALEYVHVALATHAYVSCDEIV